MSTKQDLPAIILPNAPRRRFLQGLAAGGVLFGLSPWLKPASAANRAATGTAEVLSGTEFDLLGVVPKDHLSVSDVDFRISERPADVVSGCRRGRQSGTH